MSEADDLEPPTDSTEPTVEAPAASHEPTTETAAIAEPMVAPPPAPAQPAVPSQRSGILLPKWLAVALAALLVFGLGLGTGLLIGDGHRGDREGRRDSESATGQESNQGLPNPRQGPGANRQFPFGGGTRGNASPGQGGQGTTPRQPTTPNPPSTPGNTTSAFIGIAPENSTNPAGVAIVRVQASGPAASAGLKSGDVITAIDGTKTDSVATLRDVLAYHHPGDVLKVTYTRDGKSATLDVTSTDRNATPPQ